MLDGNRPPYRMFIDPGVPWQSEKKKASEVMILCTGDLWPNKQEMQKKKIKLNLREKMHA